MRQIHTHGQLITELIEHFHMFEHNSEPIYEVVLVERTKVSKKLLDVAPVAAMKCSLSSLRLGFYLTTSPTLNQNLGYGYQHEPLRRLWH